MSMEVTNQRNHRILVVDDNRAIHDDLRKILTINGAQDFALQDDEAELFGVEAAPVADFELDSAYQGEEALEMVRRATECGRPYSVAFVDVRMPPGWDGIETITHLRKVDPNLQTVICTAYADYSWSDIQRRVGHSDSLLILKKPFDNIEVVQMAHTMSHKWLVSRQAEARMKDLDLMVAQRTEELRAANEQIRRELQEKLEAEEAFRAIFEASPIGIALMDRDGRYLDVNEALSEWCRGKGALDTVRRELEHAGSIDAKEVSYAQPEGEFRTGLLWARTIAVRNVPHSLTFLLDITERKHMERELQRAREAAEAASKAKGVFLANMSHEIRTPLNGVLGLSAMLDSEDVPEETRSKIRLIRESGEMLKTIVDDVLDLSKIESGKLELEVAPFSLQEALEFAAGLYQKTAMEKSLQMRLNFDPRIPEQVVGDSTRLKQIVANLVNNAVKFTSSGSIDVRAEMASPAERGKPCRIRVSVTDSGIGIPEDRLKRLFQPFTQIDSSTNRRYGGTGLGLAISKRLIELMGGEIRVESTPGTKTTFEFTIVFQVADKVAAAAAPGIVTTSGMRILVAEDNPINQIVIMHMLRAKGHEVDLVDNGDAAVRQVQSSAYDLVLMDMQMPGMDGLEATRRIRGLGDAFADVPITALTASATTDDRIACLEAGMNDYVSKPLNQQALSVLLERWKPGRPAKSATGYLTLTASSV